MEHLKIEIANIHCDNCKDTIYKGLRSFFKVELLEEEPKNPTDVICRTSTLVFAFIDKNNVNIYHYSNRGNDGNVIVPYIKRIVKKLRKLGFDVLSWGFEVNGETLYTSNSYVDPELQQDDVFFGLKNWFEKNADRKKKKLHEKQCMKCQEEHEVQKDARSKKEFPTSSDESFETVIDKPEKEYRAVLALSGMTCASCANSIGEQIEDALDVNTESKSSDIDAKKYSIDLLSHSAVVIVPDKNTINIIISRINDIGFECKLLELLPVRRSVNIKVSAIIGGITCASCANSIQSAVNELPFVLESGINTLAKTGQFIMEESSNSNKNLEILKTTIEDCGFDFELVSKESINYVSGQRKPRTINVEIQGMHCNHCPESILNYMNSFGDAVVVEDPISLNHPFIKFSYIPNIENGLGIRKFLHEIEHVHPSDNPDGYELDLSKKGVFQCKLVHVVSIDEQLRRITKREFFNIVYRLILTTIFVIPTFIFGVVTMSLLPHKNKFRKWSEEPIWAGSVSRNTWALFILSTPIYFFAADIFHKKTIKELKSLWLKKNSFRKRLFKFGSMNLLMTLGTSVSYFSSIVLLVLYSTMKKQIIMNTTYFDSVVFLTFFLLIGRLLESYSKGKAAEALSDLEHYKAKVVTLVDKIVNDGHIEYANDELIDIEYLEEGDYVRITPGESPPVDCVVIEGSSTFDESALTGESTPVEHFVGQQVYSGTVNNGNSAIIGKVISIEGDSLIDQIVNTVREGQLRKAPIERAADSITGYFVPTIVFLAVITWIIWVSLGYSGVLPKSYLDINSGGWVIWSLEFAIAVFVIACPCGIGLAAPTALFVGSGLASKYGILVKGGGVAFQEGSKINAICFDKTGTLTKGELKVTDFCFADDKNFSKESRAASRYFSIQFLRDLELSSKHPIAVSIKQFVAEYCNEYELVLMNNKIPRVETIAGNGLRGEIIQGNEDSKKAIWKSFKPTEAILGNEKFMKEQGVVITAEIKDILEKWKSEAKSVVLVAIKCNELFGNENFNLIVLTACRDTLRAETIPVIRYLQDTLHVDCWMVTGDNKVTAEAIASEIGIKTSNVVSDVLPSEKQKIVKKLQLITKGTVAMVGDGINDAPALASADVGIALSSGSDLAVTSSDFILLNKAHYLLTLLTLIDLSKAVFRRVRFNFGWALIYNVIGVPIAAGVIYPYHNSRLSPVWASAAMAASSVSVVLSSLLLRLYKPKLNVKDFVEVTEEPYGIAVEHKI